MIRQQRNLRIKSSHNDTKVEGHPCELILIARELKLIGAIQLLKYDTIIHSKKRKKKNDTIIMRKQIVHSA